MTWVLLGAAALAYVVAALRVPRWPARATLAWLAGCAVVAVALGTLDAGADRLLSLHMAQHQLLALVAAPLLVAAAPLGLALRAVDPGTRRALARVLASPVARVWTAPATGVAVFAAVLLAVHVPAVYGAALGSAPLHAVEHAALFWSAVALWVPLLAPRPVRRPGGVASVAALLAAMTAMGAVGAWLAGTDAVVYAHYAGVGAVADQHLAGGLMSVGGMVVVAPALLWLAWSRLAEDERRQRVREARA